MVPILVRVRDNQAPLPRCIQLPAPVALIDSRQSQCVPSRWRHLAPGRQALLATRHASAVCGRVSKAVDGWLLADAEFTALDDWM